MKKVKFFFAVALAASILSANAQTISVVAPGGATSIHTDLNLAILQAPAGSTLYLSGGGFQAHDSVKITKKLTIIGIGHRPDNDNADGNTNVSGNLFFNAGSDGSALLGVYLSGTVRIAEDNNSVNNILVRYCNVLGIHINNFYFGGGSGAPCQGIQINQNYIRGGVNGGWQAISLTNNIIGDDIHIIDGGIIEYNTILDISGGMIFIRVVNSSVRNNVIKTSDIAYCDNTVWFNNYVTRDIGTDNTIIDWATVFTGPNNGVNVSSNFHLANGNNSVGIYGGAGFSDSQLPPGPRIVKKVIADQTDENGNLRVNIEVKVGE